MPDRPSRAVPKAAAGSAMPRRPTTLALPRMLHTAHQRPCGGHTSVEQRRISAAAAAHAHQCSSRIRCVKLRLHTMLFDIASLCTPLLQPNRLFDCEQRLNSVLRSQIATDQYLPD